MCFQSGLFAGVAAACGFFAQPFFGSFFFFKDSMWYPYHSPESLSASLCLPPTPKSKVSLMVTAGSSLLASLTEQGVAT